MKRDFNLLREKVNQAVTAAVILLPVGQLHAACVNVMGSLTDAYQVERILYNEGLRSTEGDAIHDGDFHSWIME